MHRPCLLSLSLLLSILAPAARAADEAVIWRGTLETGQSLRLQVELTRAGDTLSGQLVSLDQGRSSAALESIVWDAGTLSFRVPEFGAAFEGSLSDDGDQATGTFRQGGNSLPLVLARGEADVVLESTLLEAWVGQLELGPFSPTMQLRVVEFADGSPGAFFDSITEGRLDFPAKWSLEEGTLSFAVPSIRAVFEGTLDDAGQVATGTFFQGGRELPLSLRRSSEAEASSATWEQRPQRPRAPFPYDDHEVRFENTRDGVVLAGTLSVPHGEGPHPAVVLVSGSGPQDRDETLMGHKPFAVLADQLARRGIAVLRYDDRGTAGSTGEFDGCTTWDFAADADAAVDFLIGHAAIDAGQVGIVGHSEGGLVAPMVASGRDDLAHIVLMAGPAVDGHTTLLSQGHAMAAAEGVSESELSIAAHIRGFVLDRALQAGPGDDVGALMVAGFDEALAELPEEQRAQAAAERDALLLNTGSLDPIWFQHFLHYEPATTLARVDCPVLALLCGKDVQVLADVNREPMRRALATGHPANRLHEFADLNHLFQTADSGAMSEYAAIDETFDPAALELIGDWVWARAGTPAR